MSDNGTEIKAALESLCQLVLSLDGNAQIEALNMCKLALHKISPFRNEPVDCVLWVEADRVESNDYNPNTVAPPEMELLQHSVREDGYTQPVVSWDRGTHFEVVDGFHRKRVGTECDDIRERLAGYLPLTIIQGSREDRGDRIASTIRHNRARGKHGVSPMSDIVVELKKRNWTNKKIGKELGMDPDEVLRLSQISGLAELFSDKEFSEAWEAADPLEINEEDNLDVAEEDCME
jgi:ParB-like chromosome segregation protein Spo0J